MLAALKALLIVEDATADQATSAHCAQLAASALLLDMARADHEVAPIELETLMQSIEKSFELDPDETRLLLENAEQDLDAATSLFEFTSVINDHFSHEQKIQLVESLWRVAYADGRIDRFEAHLVRKVSELVHLRHREYIGAKLRAEKRARLDGGG